MNMSSAASAGLRLFKIYLHRVFNTADVIALENIVQSEKVTVPYYFPQCQDK